MTTATRTLITLICVLICSLSALAQTEQPIDTQPTPKPTQAPSSIIITATVHTERVRFVSIGEVNQTRVQVFATDGSVVFDSNYRLGNLIDWSLPTQPSQNLSDGSYLFLVSVKDFAGNLTQKYGMALLEQNQVSLQQSSREELSGAQATDLTANQLAATLSPIDRIGAMGLNSSISTSTDQATTNQKKGKDATSGGTNLTTAGTIAKFADNSGTLTNSLITESSNQVVITGNQLIIPAGATPTYEVLAGSDPSSTVMLTTNSSNFGWQIAPTNASNDTIIQVLGQTFASTPNRGEFGIYLGADTNSAFRVVQRSGPELFRVNRFGNVGIGTTSPQAKLDVAGDINTSTRYNFGNQPVLAVTGNSTFPNSNTFVGIGAGTSNTPDPNNTGNGMLNSFFGKNAGQKNTTGEANSFFGSGAGQSNTTLCCNSFFGQNAGNNNTGFSNSFFGDSAGLLNTTGSSNSAFGLNAGLSNHTGSNNTYLGAISDSADGLTNATAIGSNAFVTQSNSLVLGSINGQNNATADTFVGIGVTAPRGGLEVKRNWDGSFGAITVTGDRPTIRFSAADSTAANQQWILHLGSVAGTAPAGSLSFFNGGTAGTSYGSPVLALTPNKTVMITNLGAGGTQLCRNGSNEISDCASSLRYKTDVTRFVGGLSIIHRLRPISFTWKQDGKRDIGLGAEEVEKVEPLLTFRNAKGEIEGVKYNQLSAVFVNAIEEQQEEINKQQEEIKELTAEVRRLHTVSRRHRPRGRR